MKNELYVNGIDVKYKRINKDDYISLTDLARYVNPDEPKIPIQTWMRNKDVVSYLGLWEQLNNPNFKGREFTTFENKSGANSFYLSPEKWVNETNAIGIIVKRGNGGGTYAHRDIAFEFASWLSPEFKLYLITEFQRLKAQEQKTIEWSAKRELAKVNYRIHTDAIKENIVPTLTEAQLKYVYADEADLLNVALFGETAAEWRKQNPTLKGNIRDYATIEQLLVIANTTTAYGFNKNVLAEDPARNLKASDFAKFHGVSMGNTQKDYVTWYTRSPSLAVGNQGYTTFVLYRDNKGVINSPDLVAEGGVVPALWIIL